MTERERPHEIEFMDQDLDTIFRRHIETPNTTLGLESTYIYIYIYRCVLCCIGRPKCMGHREGGFRTGSCGSGYSVQEARKGLAYRTYAVARGGIGRKRTSARSPCALAVQLSGAWPIIRI
jgi:hypothetical protein